MLRVLKRVYERGCLIGYKVEDESGRTHLIHIIKFKEAVENGEVQNFVMEQGKVVGTNGHSLNTLPKMSIDS